MKTYDKVRHTILVKEELSAHFRSDLVYIKDIPHIVLVWNTSSDGKEHPAYAVPIDPAKLHQLNWPEEKYLYEMPIELNLKDYETLKPFLHIPKK